MVMPAGTTDSVGLPMIMGMGMIVLVVVSMVMARLSRRCLSHDISVYISPDVKALR
jgi:hypothetical protein